MVKENVKAKNVSIIINPRMAIPYNHIEPSHFFFFYILYVYIQKLTQK